MTLIRYASAGGVVLRDGQMLLLDRPSRGEVRLPKGHINADETPQAAALRETCEETGYVDLSIFDSLGSQLVEFHYEGRDYVRTEHYFLMRLDSLRLASRSPDDEAQFQPIWVSIDQAVGRLTFASEQEFARRAVATLKDA